MRYKEISLLVFSRIFTDFFLHKGPFQNDNLFLFTYVILFLRVDRDCFFIVWFTTLLYQAFLYYFWLPPWWMLFQVSPNHFVCKHLCSSDFWSGLQLMILTECISFCLLIFLGYTLSSLFHQSIFHWCSLPKQRGDLCYYKQTFSIITHFQATHIWNVRLFPANITHF